MPQSYSPSLIVQIAKLSSVYADRECATQRLYGGASIDSNLAVILAMEAWILDRHNLYYPSDPTLPTVANYVLALCGRFIPRALAALGQGGAGIIIDPGTGQPINVQGRVFQFTVGDPTTAPPLLPGWYDMGYKRISCSRYIPFYRL